ncbi:MAG: hypothetical protein J5996_07835 [Prevotella sp.]|nr:hypothetical protein [Prevotella sp.]
MKRFLFTVMKMFFICLLLLSGMERAYAQVNVDPAEYKGTGTDISKLNWDETNQTAKDDPVLLYNVGKDMFLTAGGLWGTRTATFTVGLPLRLTRINKGTDKYPVYVYRIQGPFNNTNTGEAGIGVGQLLGFVNGDGVYFDRGESSSKVDWTFEKDDQASKDGNVVYRIKTSDNYYLYANEKMTINVFEGGNNNLVNALAYDNAKDKYGQWKIVQLSQMETEFNETYNKDHPSDATFFMRAQNFNRMNIYNTYNEDEGRGWMQSKGSNFTYSTKFDDVTKDYKGNNNTYQKQDDKIYGMFYCGSIKNGKKGDKLYQNVTITQSGWYRIDCQGMFYNADDPDKAIAQLYAKVKSDNESGGNTIDNAYVDLLPKSYGEPVDVEFSYPKENMPDYIATQGPRNIPYYANNNGVVDNKIEASALFYNQKYPNHLLIYVSSASNDSEIVSKTLELGIDITGDMADDDYVYFDDFQLRYLGKSFALDEGVTDFHNMGDDNEVYKNRVMIFKRTYKNDTWNSICLPVNLTKEQLNTAFFPNPKLAKLVESDTPETIAFQMVELDDLDNNDVALRKGECYLIKPGYAGRTGEGEIEIGDGKRTMITAPYYTIDRVTLTKKDVETDLVFSKDDNVHRFIDRKDLSGKERTEDYYTIKDSECKLRVYGTFEKLGADNPLVPKTSYTFVNGKLYHLTGAYAQKGFSCWIEDGHQVANPETQSHTLNINTYIGGISDNTTAIEGFTADVTERDLPQAVYNLQGQAVRRGTTSLEGLARGMYIVNGKKVAVRE